MADEIKSGQIRLKVDPKALRQAKNDVSERTPAPIITEHDVNGRTLSLRKEDEPIQMITPAAAEALPMEVVEAQQSKKALKKRKEELDIKNKQRKHPKRVLTNAEKNYWRVIFVSLFITFAILIVAAGVAVGTVSFSCSPGSLKIRPMLRPCTMRQLGSAMPEVCPKNMRSWFRLTMKCATLT